MQIGPSNCLRRLCKHYAGQDGSRESLVFTCDAFPDGIPQSILFGTDLHLAPVDGQENDVVYEEVKTRADLDELMDRILNHGGKLSHIAGR